MNDLKEYFWKDTTEEFKNINAVDDRIQKSKKGCAIFYYLHKDIASEEKLRNYLSAHQPDLLILNREFSVSVPMVLAREDKWIECQKFFCDKYYPNSLKPKILAITGTNGKTTTADLVLQLASLINLKAISIGTLGVRDKNGLIEDFGLTTPSFLQLRRILFEHAQDCDLVAMEASSHALEQRRVLGLSFYAAGWTSFTQDHLDYHKTMDSYFEAKERIVEYLRPRGKLFFPDSQAHVASKIKNQDVCVLLDPLDQELRLRLPPFFKTKFNLDNLSVALALIAEVHPDLSKINIKELNPTPGRFYIKEWNKRVAIIDFAHTPDALENLLSAVKEIYPSHRLKVLFGCGGDRDRSKRPLMGLAVQKYADEIIITSDNPRTENAMQIIDDIAKPLNSEKYKKIEKRSDALINELKVLNPNEVLVVAGKGHEDYIIIGTVKYPYSDIKTLENFLQVK